MDEKEDRVSKNLTILNNMGCMFSIILMSENMLSHSIADANSLLRQILSEANIHDYSKQKFGPDYKIEISTEYLAYKPFEKGLSTLYRASSRGDCRIWFGPFTRKYVSPDDKLAIFAINNKLYLLNLSQYNINRALTSDFENPIKQFLTHYFE
ncbi:MAG: hypothetical protein K2K45_03150 [Muribaculaceae bacterium]|nr:hypothetical protein [Muribaculaceae bacterium]